RGGRSRAPGRGPDLLALLAAGGVETVLVRDRSRPGPPELEAGWQRVRHIGPDRSGSALEETLAAAEAQLCRLADRDGWLVWVELAMLLPPWEVPEEFLLHYFDEAETEEAPEEEEKGKEE